MTSVSILGMGIQSHVGSGLAETVAALRRPPSAPPTVDVHVGAMHEAVPVLGMGDVLADPKTRLHSRAEAAAREAIANAGLTPDQLKRCAFLLGTSSLDISVTEAAYAQDLATTPDDAHPLMSNSAMGELGRSLAERLGIGGVDLTINTACTASANALAYADAMIRAGRTDYAIVMGLEFFNRITALGFRGLELLSPNGMRPFDRSRSGLVLGEAAAAVVLGKSDKPGGFRLAGSANMCDTYGVSAANPDGSTVAEVIAGAIEKAGIAPSDIRAVKSHGTASLLNDEAEASGLRRVFGEASPPVIALKPFIGHTFGACGLAELVMLAASIDAGFIPGTPGVSPDKGELGVTLVQQAQPAKPGAYLLNYFGFGGNNTSLVIANG